MKDLIRLKKYIKYQEASSILKVGFALLKYPYFNRAYVVSSGFGCLYLYHLNCKLILGLIVFQPL